MRLAIVFLALSITLNCCREPLSNDQVIGDIAGTVVLLDEFGGREADQSGTTVKCEGEITLYAVTDAAGKWTIQNVPTGVFTLTFQKPGHLCLSDRQFLSFIGDGVVKYSNSYTHKSDVALCRESSVPITLDALIISKDQPAANGKLYAHFPEGRPKKAKASFFLIASRNSNLTITNKLSYEQCKNYGPYSDTNEIDVTIPIDYSEEPFKGFNADDRVYVRAYTYYGSYNIYSKAVNKNITLFNFEDTSAILTTVAQ